jgi:cytochrome c
MQNKIKIIFVGMCVLLFSCSENNKAAENKTDAQPTENKLANNPDYHRGTELFYKNDCGTCHANNVKLSGPSYAEITAKYNADTAMIPMLADRIIKGGKGVWGEAIMTPHPNLSKEDAVALVKYIYLIKE